MSPWPRDKADARPMHPWSPQEAECLLAGTAGPVDQPVAGPILPGVAPGSKRQ